MKHEPQYPRSTPRHRREERLTCPRNGATVQGHFCIAYCPHAEEQGEGALYFTCDLLDRERRPGDALSTQAR